MSWARSLMQRNAPSAGAAGTSRRPRKAGPGVESLEGKVVLSGFGGGLGRAIAQDIRAFFDHGHGGNSGAANSMLTQDARQVQKAFQTLDSSFLSAASALRKTATLAGAPTAAGLTAYNNAIATAIANLNTSVASSLSNLTTSGASLSQTIQGYTATLQDELQSAGAGLENSGNRAFRALKSEGNGDINATLRQATSAILAATPTGTITSSQVSTYRGAASDAYRTFRLAISNAEQASISGGTALSADAVTAAVSSLQSSLTPALGGLGAGLASSAYNPATKVTTDLTNLSSALTSITAPTAGNTVSSRLFLRTVSSTINTYTSMIDRDVTTAVQNYNNSLV